MKVYVFTLTIVRVDLQVEPHVAVSISVKVSTAVMVDNDSDRERCLEGVLIDVFAAATKLAPIVDVLVNVFKLKSVRVDLHVGPQVAVSMSVKVSTAVMVENDSGR